MIETVAAPLLKRNVYEPRFEKKTGTVVAFEKGTLFGIEIFNQRKINYEKINPQEARELFIRQGLIEQQAHITCRFYQKNKETIEALEQLSDRIRKDHYFVDDAFLFAFYDERLPAEVNSVHALVRWLQRQDDSFLIFTKEQVSTSMALVTTEQEYPSTLTIQGHAFSVQYKFDPTSPDDGATLRVPLSQLARIKDEDFTTLLPPAYANQKKMLRTKQGPKHLQLHFSVL